MASFFAKVYLETLAFRARWGLQESQEWMGTKGSQASCAPIVLVSQGLRASQDCRGGMA